MIKWRCKHCTETLEAPDSEKWNFITCPRCRNSVRVPSPGCVTKPSLWGLFVIIGICIWMVLIVRSIVIINIAEQARYESYYGISKDTFNSDHAEQLRNNNTNTMFLAGTLFVVVGGLMREIKISRDMELANNLPSEAVDE